MLPKIIASLTTIPSRIDSLHHTIESILKQTTSVSSIELNIPHVFKRDCEAYKIPDWLLKLAESSKDTHCTVRIFRTRDYGAITKVAPTIIRHREEKDVLIWSVDDDFKYPDNMLSVLVDAYTPDNRYVLSHSGGNWIYEKDMTDEIYHPWATGDCLEFKTQRDEGINDFLEGFASVLYPASLFLDDFEDYIAMTSRVLDNRNSDDIIMSNYLALKDIEIYNCEWKVKAYQIPFSEQSNGMKWGQDADALHKQQDGHRKRYIRVFNWLKAEEINGWLKRKQLVKLK